MKQTVPAAYKESKGVLPPSKNTLKADEITTTEEKLLEKHRIEHWRRPKNRDLYSRRRRVETGRWVWIRGKTG